MGTTSAPPGPVGRRFLLAGAATASVPPAAPSARAQPVAAAVSWPQGRPVRLVVPFPPGGSNDVIARPLAERLQARTGQPFVVENRPGAGGAIGAAQVAQAPADGHTLMVTSSSFATSAVSQRTPWDALGSFDAVALLARAPFFVMVHPDLPARNLADLVRLARGTPGGLDYGTSGAGGINHFVTEYLCLRAGIRMTPVPYRGTAPAVTDLIAGNIRVMVTTVASASAAIREGRVRVIAATAPGGGLPPNLGEVPTAREQGLDYEVSIWWGLLAPRGLPQEVRTAIHAAANAALDDPELLRIYEGEGARPARGGRPEEFPALLKEELGRWREVAQAAGIRAE
jgi:tripartite-type tricarboxylate transporter receptor subunit TctC